MSTEEVECHGCQATGYYCYVCGEVEDHCQCQEDEQNIGVCDMCDGHGWAPDE